MLPLLATWCLPAACAHCGAIAGDGLLSALVPAGIMFVAAWLTQADARSAGHHPPVANVVPKAHSLHGDVRVDNYSWLRERTNPEVIRYLESENAYTEALMEPASALREILYAEMLGRIRETDVAAPYRERSHWYYSRTEEGKQYPVYCRKEGSLEAPESVILDQNELSRGYGFFALGTMAVSPDEWMLAYTADTNGSETFDLYVKDLRTGANAPDRIRDVESVTWAMDNATLLYTTRDEAKRPFRLWKHRLGTEASSDVLLYEEPDQLFTLAVSRSKSDEYIFIQSSSSTSDEVRYLSAYDPSAPLAVLLPRRTDVEYSVAHHGDAFYILTNLSAKNFRVVKAPVVDHVPARWTDVVAHREDVTLEWMEFFRNHFVLFEREAGLQQMRVIDLRSAAAHRIAFPEPVYSAFAGANRVWDTKAFRFTYQSFITPPSVYDYDMETRERTLRKRQDVLGGYRPEEYCSERLFASAADGTRVPMSVVYRVGMKKDGTSPMHLTAYGAYGISAPVMFSSNRLSLLDRGVVFGVAHVRGGGDLGRDWKEGGRMLRKKNSFTDFIVCAEHLIGEKYTSSDRLTIEGASAGGLLTGAVANIRPDLFKAVVAQVPFVDVLNTMLDPTLPLTVGEYLEWGNPNEKEYYDYIKSYCPYTNVRPQAYPNILVKVGLNDPRVCYWEGAKWVAKLRAMKTDNNVILLKVNMGAGHGGSSGRYDKLKEIAFDYAYILSQYGSHSAPKAPDTNWNK